MDSPEERTSKQDPSADSEWSDLEHVVTALHRSMYRAHQQITADKSSDTKFVVTDFKIDFPAQVHHAAPDRIRVRLPKGPGTGLLEQESKEQAAETASHLSRVAIAFRPMPRSLLEEEPAPEGPKPNERST